MIATTNAGPAGEVHDEGLHSKMDSNVERLDFKSKFNANWLEKTPNYTEQGLARHEVFCISEL